MNALIYNVRSRKDKESLVKMSSDITSNLMVLSRTLYGQVLQNEDSLQTLGEFILYFTSYQPVQIMGLV